MTDHCFSCYLLRGITSLLEKKNVILCCLTTTLAISIWISQIRNGQWQSFLQFQILKIDLNWRNYDEMLLWSKRVHMCQKFQRLMRQLSQNRKKNPMATSHYCYGNCTVWKNLWINTFTSIVQGRGEKEEKGKKKIKGTENIWTEAFRQTLPPATLVITECVEKQTKQTKDTIDNTPIRPRFCKAIFSYLFLWIFHPHWHCIFPV